MNKKLFVFLLMSNFYCLDSVASNAEKLSNKSTTSTQQLVQSAPAVKLWETRQSNPAKCMAAKNGTLYFVPINERCIHQASSDTGKSSIGVSIEGRDAIQTLLAGEKLFFSAGSTLYCTNYDMQSDAKSFTAEPLIAHTDAITSLALKDDTLYSGSNDQTVCVWDVATTQAITRLVDKWCAIKTIALSEDNSQLLVAAGLCLARWDTKSNQLIKLCRIAEGCIQTVAVGPDQTVYVASDNTIAIWDVRKEEVCGTLQGHDNDIKSLQISGDKSALFSCSNDCSVFVWDTKEQNKIASIEHEPSALLQLDPDQSTLYVSSSKNLACFRTAKKPQESTKNSLIPSFLRLFS